jgi:predicted component of type VI protein secretion system
MYKKLAILTIFLASLINNQGYADEEIQQVRKDCENEVQAYGIVDPEEYQQALSDCIDNMTTTIPVEQNEDGRISNERT